MKKVALITWHSLENYGRALQNYALFTILKEKGYNVEVINYVKNAKNNIFYRLYRNLKRNFSIKTNSYWYRTNRFLNFRKKYLKETTLYSSLEQLSEISNNYDIFICGSDQIWSPNRLDYAYFLSFTSKPKISYAPSIVIDEIKKDDLNEIRKNLNNFRYISVREQKGKEILRKIIDKDIEVVLDPTLLLEKENYEKIMRQMPINEQYLLCYLIGNRLEHRTLVKKIASKFNLKIVTLPFKVADENFGDIILKGVGPEEFLDLVQNAKLICTDSYHGMLLSIVLEKDFYEFPRFLNSDKMSQNARVNEVIEMFGLKNRLIDNIDDVTLDKIDYEKVNAIKKVKQKESINYLINALKGVEDDRN